MKPLQMHAPHYRLIAPLACLVLAASLFSASADEKQPAWPDRQIEDFSLKECGGRTVTRADLLGQPWLASFIFTHCVGPCPRVTAEMEKLQKKTRGMGVRLVSFTVDPKRDTPDVLRAYADLHNAEPDRWWFLTGDRDKIYHLIEHSFLMPVREDPQGGFGAEVIHSTNIMHVDAEGRVIGKYNAQDDVDMARLRRALGKADSSDGTLIADQDAKDKQARAARETESMQELAALDDAVRKADRVVDFEKLPLWIKALPPLNATLNATAGVILLFGLRLIRSGQTEAHKRAMISAFAVSTLFLTCYLIYHFALLILLGSGSRKFAGEGLIAYVYKTILFSHIILAFGVAVLAPLTLYLGLKSRWKQHRRIARITFPIWLYVSVTGVIIFVMLYLVG